ncbi:MAG: ATP-binding protein [Tannerella sp.]|jgi:hypothetical protein|nr:ATP-binding protein [Tannerella sp.]
MKQLALDTQSFEKLRSRNCLYVDKTEVIHRMITDGRIYFLSRPRRFGKSLLVSTLEAIFQGKKNLFEGLYIYDKWDWEQQYPVIIIDWTKINHSTPKEMKESLVLCLKKIAENYQIILEAKSAIDYFSDLIEALHKKTGKDVVILIDEYDKPITAHLSDSNLKAFQTAIHDFYQVIKGADEFLKLVFLTGVSRFSGLSIFSALNNPQDITLQEEYAAICGYTQEELESNFSEHIDRAAEYLNMTGEETLEQIRYWYNGYTWDGKTAIYNPFSTMKFFQNRRFTDYWFRSGTPTFLMDMIRSRNRSDAVLEPIVVDEKIFDGYDPAGTGEISLLFQTGYLTIKKMELIGGFARYTLGVPNMEVKEALVEHLLSAYSENNIETIHSMIPKIQSQIYEGKTAALEQSLRSLLAHIPNNLHVENESYYHSLFLFLMATLGFDIQGEVLTNIGRIDAVWRQAGLTVVAEIKYSAKKKIDNLLNSAMRQIRKRKYYETYLNDTKVMLMAIAFTEKEIKCRMSRI